MVMIMVLFHHVANDIFEIY